jgi:RHH-type proline utilization regulon transcriptional repressor/proline dehydrogenase/delta 1-pyrroline-5-carboxylate dehydrogenase
LEIDGYKIEKLPKDGEIMSVSELPIQKIRADINNYYRIDEEQLIADLILKAKLSPDQSQKVSKLAQNLVRKVRSSPREGKLIESFLAEYSLYSEEGKALLALAEAIPRIPDKFTMNKLIQDQLSSTHWEIHSGHSDTRLVNIATWFFLKVGRVLASKKIHFLINKGLLRKIMYKSMNLLGKQFVIAPTIEQALIVAKKKESLGYRYSFDMLGEAALTQEVSDRYFKAYEHAIDSLNFFIEKNNSVLKRPGISIKLSALYPRYQELQREKVMEYLPFKLLALAQKAKKNNITLTVDAEESERLDLSLDIIEQVFNHPSLEGWEGFGLAIQAYQKRAYFILDWAAELAKNKNRRMMVRLVKGAYWDSEIKKTQMAGLSNYPVFTHKSFTDVSFQACAKKMFDLRELIYSQFATHNAYSAAMLMTLAGEYKDFEFQCLYGMGTELYEQIVQQGIPCRIYAPIGNQEDLLPYLIRRLLENGANSSFVHSISNEKISIETIVADPIEQAIQLIEGKKEIIPLPKDIFLPQRPNSLGFDFTDRKAVYNLKKQFSPIKPAYWQSYPILAKKKSSNKEIRTVVSPQNLNRNIGKVVDADAKDIDWALSQTGLQNWSSKPVVERANCIQLYAKKLEAHKTELLYLLVMEAGKTWQSAVSELREAIDYCYYYSERARHLMEKPAKLQGYTGEVNELSLHPLGTVLCISPWNFPLAIFTGQIVAALLTGNCVIAKPAEQTPLIAAYVVNLMLESGIPSGVIQLLPGRGEEVGASLVQDQRIKGIIFTGSMDTAAAINKSLANRGGSIIPFIAETGGQNAMIVDSSALLEQVAIDVLTSAFESAGQRCSALRVLYIQEEVYEPLIKLIKGAMAELQMGDPLDLKTDIGPVIDKEALISLNDYVKKSDQILYQCPIPESCAAGFFMPPTLIAIDSILSLSKEIFGPVLHVISYKSELLDQVIEDINNIGYGLTLGIQSRIDSTIQHIKQKIKVGNCYVNRNMIGAVVGLQPFGGEGLSGTGPKAGGPYYLLRLCRERTFTLDTTAAGGNVSLMAFFMDE